MAVVHYFISGWLDAARVTVKVEGVVVPVGQDEVKDKPKEDDDRIQRKECRRRAVQRQTQRYLS
jgi:hypothetical protein